jgi:prepilin-type processing-associated H-X9-DG protein
MHSWRVLILPFFEPGIYSTEADQNLFAAVYKKYRFDEPWDGPHNRELMSQCPDIYRCPIDQGPTTETSYVVVVGPTTVFPAEKCLKMMDIADGTTNTIMVVEMANSGINWIEPRDLTFDQALRGVNPKLQVGISSHHQGGAQAVFADGSVHFLKDETPPADLRLLLEINDGKPAPNLPGW